MKLRKLYIEMICFFTIVLFIYTACAKLFEFDKFRLQIGQSPLLTAHARPISVVIPFSEIVISLMLMIHRLRIIGLFASYMLMITFAAYVFYIINYANYIPCSCGGIIEKMNWQQHLSFNIGFVVLLAIAIVIFPKNENGVLTISGVPKTEIKE